jgi:hypothetical protein
MHWLPPAAHFPPIDYHHAVGETQGKGVLWINFVQIGAYYELAPVSDELPEFELAMPDQTLTVESRQVDAVVETSAGADPM